MSRLALVLLIAAAVAGCHAASEKPDMSVIPDTLLTCSSAPKWQGGTQRNVASFTEDLGDAHADCFGKLGEVRAIARGKAR